MRKLEPITGNLPTPPKDVDANYMRQMVGALQRMLHNIEKPATLKGGMLNLSETPFDAYDLLVGDVWIDVNVLKIIRIGDYGVLGSGISILNGSVTVTTV
jgi:hypothetical protein